MYSIFCLCVYEHVTKLTHLCTGDNKARRKEFWTSVQYGSLNLDLYSVETCIDPLFIHSAALLQLQDVFGSKR